MQVRRFLGAALTALALLSIATPAWAQLDSDRFAVAAMSAGEVAREVRCRRGKICKQRPRKVETGVQAASGVRFITGRLVCAVNVNAALAARGIKGTGSAFAKSFLHWGHATAPKSGAVAVFNRGARGGHVAIVHSVKADGTILYLNPSSSQQAWVIGPYHKRPIAFRAAS